MQCSCTASSALTARSPPGLEGCKWNPDTSSAGAKPTSIRELAGSPPLNLRSALNESGALLDLRAGSPPTRPGAAGSYPRQCLYFCASNFVLVTR